MPEEKKNPPHTEYAAHILAGLFALLLFFTPLFPDVKLTRPKLLLLETGLYTLFFLWLLSGIRRRALSIHRSPLFLPLAAYGALTALFYYLSPDRPVALNELKRAFLSITAYIVAAHMITSQRSRAAALYAWLAGSFLALGYGILQHFGGVWHISVPHLTRVMSTFGNPIFFAAHITLSVPIALGLGVATRNRFARLFSFLYLLAAAFALYYAQTRAAYIGCFVSLIVFILLSLRSARHTYALLAGLVIAGSIFAFATKNIWSRHQAHTLIWRDTLAMWSHAPFAGTGPGTFHIYFPSFASEELKNIWPQDQAIVNDAHNEYLQYLSETGIVGFGVFAWLLITFFASALLLFARGVPSRFVFAGLVASAAGILAQNFFSVDMRFIISAAYLFMVMGLVGSFDETPITIAFSPRARLIAAALTLAVAGLVFHKTLQPYIAQRNVANTPDFFDDKLLEPAKTVAELEALAVRYPDTSSVHEKLGWVYAKEKKFDRAIYHYETASRLNPQISGPLNNLGNIYFLLNDRAKAIAYWERSLAINPGQTDSRLNLATAYYYNGELKKATDALKKVLALDPGNEKALVMLKQMVE